MNSAMGGGQYSANFGIRQIFYYILGAIFAGIKCLFHLKRLNIIHIYCIS
ncbi:hypothetical protein O639_02762 [Staphylococcus aureus M0611]|nr:hypothetical protein O639_02762 [Staphylococcus aureus M0611]